MRILAIIPARGGSKGIPRKNIKVLAGKPLITYTIEAALQARSLDRVIVSTDDAEIAEVARQFGAEVMMRPDELAQDETPTLPVLQNVVARLAEEGYKPDAVMTLQPTSPLRQVHHIDEAAAEFLADPKADSLVSCVQVPHHFHPLSLMKTNDEGYLEPYIAQEKLVTRRQDKGQVFARNGAAVYITRTEKLAEFIFGGRLLSFEMDALSSQDIDTPEDFSTIDRWLTQQKETYVID